VQTLVRSLSWSRTVGCEVPRPPTGRSSTFDAAGNGPTRTLKGLPQKSICSWPFLLLVGCFLIQGIILACGNAGYSSGRWRGLRRSWSNSSTWTLKREYCRWSRQICFASDSKHSFVFEEEWAFLSPRLSLSLSLFLSLSLSQWPVFSFSSVSRLFITSTSSPPAT
jgi:hypothetical protein